VSSAEGRAARRGPPPPVPDGCDTRAAFAACLLELMTWAHRSHRGVAAKSRASGRAISPTTAANLTAGTTQPQLRSLVGFLHGCGLPANQHQPWVSAYRQLFPRSSAAEPSNQPSAAARQRHR
jgi:hypothetical protein